MLLVCDFDCYILTIDLKKAVAFEINKEELIVHFDDIENKMTIEFGVKLTKEQIKKLNVILATGKNKEMILDLKKLIENLTGTNKGGENDKQK